MNSRSVDNWKPADWDATAADQGLVLAEVGSCDIFDLLMSEFKGPQPTTSFQPQLIKQHTEEHFNRNSGRTVLPQEGKCFASCQGPAQSSFQHQLSTQTKLLKDGITFVHNSRSNMQDGNRQQSKRPLQAANETQSSAQKRRRQKVQQKIKDLQELLPDCGKKDTASVLDRTIKHIKLLKCQAEWLKLQYMPMAPEFIPTPALFYSSILPSPGLLMQVPLPPPQPPPQQTECSSTGVPGGATYEAEDGGQLIKINTG